MDKVFIDNLTVETVIGVYDWERTIKQRLELDIEMAWDNKPAAASDDLQYALDYKAVSDRLIAFIEGSAFLLVETLTEQVADIILQEFNAKAVKIRLRKPAAVPQARAVGVEISRGNWN